MVLGSRSGWRTLIINMHLFHYTTQICASEMCVHFIVAALDDIREHEFAIIPGITIAFGVFVCAVALPRDPPTNIYANVCDNARSHYVYGKML